ncbi:hypothetical protein WICPIJ_002790 [Wickerhamomyces pijperi]|uniref:Uncharacterized protein n=1 Tax=Wickerhamomyces pijperi TaxID=599730 RepID=A0A9P8Q8X6_WICPI|nr:hypothetical protein WICPIJ_002790 [Wickerhamomyces pijperi]
MVSFKDSQTSLNSAIEFGELAIIGRHFKHGKGEDFEEITAPESMQSIVIEKDKQLTIGRSESNSLIIDHTAVSSVHCRVWAIQFDENSIPLVYIKDTSLNGTFVNKEKISKNQTYLLNHGDVITIKFGVSLKFLSVLGADELSYGRSLIQTDKIQTQFAKWVVKERVLGNGTFGNVFVCQQSATKKLCAVKIIKSTADSVSFESKVLSKLSHPNIIKVYESHIINSRLYIFEDLICGGDLFSYLADGDALTSIPEFESLIITFQISQALEYLHSQNIAHRDLKLDNILLEAPQPFTRIVLADFGIARTVSDSREKRRMFTTVGTPEYCAPEVGFEYSKTPHHLRAKLFKNPPVNPGYDTKCDIWSLGVISHIMLSGISPFYGDGDEFSIVRNAKLGRLQLHSKQWDGVSDNAKDFIQCLLYVDIEKRYDVGKCLQHPWIKKHEVELKKTYLKILSESCFSIQE